MFHVRLFISILVTSLFSLTCIAETNPHKLTLSGQVRAANTNIQLIGAELTLVSPSNDTIRSKAESYRRSGTRKSRQLTQTSGFYISLPAVEAGDYLLSVDYPGYNTLLLTLNFSDLGKREYMRNIGTLYLEREMSKALNELNVTASKVKFYNKGDTIVYNADAFNLAEGSMLDELIKQLPGVELKEGGKIYVNGRYVESLLLNGKDFFKGKNEVMLENLGAYTVKNVQVYEKETDKSRFIGQQVEENEFVMDVNLKKEYIGGLIVNAEGGYGTQDRYMGRLFGMHFNPTARYTFYANANNLSDKRKPGEEDSWNPQSGQSGLLRHLEAGVDYYTEIGDEGKSNVTGNATVKQDRTHLATLTDAVNFYPSGNMSSRSDANNVNRNLELSTSHKLYIEKSSFTIGVEPSVDYTRSRGRSLNRSLNLNVEKPADEVTADMNKVFAHGIGSIDRDQLINATYSEAFSGNNRLRFGTIANSTILIPKTADYINLFLQYHHTNNRNDSRSDYMIGYGDPTQQSLYRRQHTAGRPNHNHAVIAEATYNYRLSDSWRIAFTADTRYDRDIRNSNFYMAQASAEASGDFSLDNLVSLSEQFDPSNSYHSLETAHRVSLNPSLTYSSKKIYIDIDVPVAYMNRQLDYNRDGRVYPISHHRWILRKAHTTFRYSISDKAKYSHILFNYFIDTKLPNLRHMIDIVDTTDPLKTYYGNRGLKSSLTHSLNLYFNKSLRNKYYYSLNIGGDFESNRAVQSYTFDTTTGHTAYKWLNADAPTYSLRQSIEGTLYFGPKGCFEATARFKANQSKDLQMIGENSLTPSLYKMNNYYYTPMISLEYEFGKQRIGIFGEVALRHSVSTRPESKDINSRDFKYGIIGNFNLPYNFGISSDFTVYQRRGYDSDLLNTSDLVWNARISKSLDNGKWLIAIDGFDLLHQLTNISYSVSASGRIEKWTNTLPRYVLFHVQYKINVLPKKKELKTNTFSF